MSNSSGTLPAIMESARHATSSLGNWAWEQAGDFVTHLPQKLQKGAEKINKFVDNHTLFSYGVVNLYHMYFSRVPYALGFIAGLSAKLMPGLKLTNLDLFPSFEGKRIFVIASLVASLFFSLHLRAFITGFAAGNEMKSVYDGLSKVTPRSQQRSMEMPMQEMRSEGSRSWHEAHARAVSSQSASVSSDYSSPVAMTPLPTSTAALASSSSSAVHSTVVTKRRDSGDYEMVSTESVAAVTQASAPSNKDAYIEYNA